MNLQKKASYVAIASLYLLGIPTALALSLWAGYGVSGLVAGFGIAIFFQSISYLTLLLRTNWQEVADEAVERIRKEEGELKNPTTKKIEMQYEVA